MKYDDKLLLKLEKNLSKYFPDQKMKIIKMEKVSELRKDFLETKTYKIFLNSSGEKFGDKIVYTKYFTDYKLKKIGGIKKLKKFNNYAEKLKIPKIYDIYEDLNTIIIESFDGEPASNLFPIYLLPGLRGLYFERVKKIIKDVGEAVSNLHKITLTEDGSNNTLNFNDLKLANILYDGEELKIIDFELVKKHYTEDVTSFMLSLDFLEKFPYIGHRIIDKMKNIFCETYFGLMEWEIDQKLLKEKMQEKRKEMLQTLMNENIRRNASIFRKIIMRYNAAYLKKRLKR